MTQEHKANKSWLSDIGYDLYGCRPGEGRDPDLSAIHRGKCLKQWSRAWKLWLIEKTNPEWKDLLDPE